MIRTVKGFGIVNKAEIDVFLELSCFINDPMDVGNLGLSCPIYKVWLIIVPASCGCSENGTNQHMESACNSVWDGTFCLVLSVLPWAADTRGGGTFEILLPWNFPVWWDGGGGRCPVLGTNSESWITLWERRVRK